MSVDEYPPQNKRQLFVRGRIPSPNHEAIIRPLDECPPQNVGQVRPVDEYPPQNVGQESICLMVEYPLHNMGQVFVPWTKILCNTWGKYSYYERIPSATHGARTCPWRNSTNSTNGSGSYSSNLFVFVRGLQPCDSHTSSNRPSSIVDHLDPNLPL